MGKVEGKIVFLFQKIKHEFRMKLNSVLAAVIYEKIEFLASLFLFSRFCVSSFSTLFESFSLFCYFVPSSCLEAVSSPASIADTKHGSI